MQLCHFEIETGWKIRLLAFLPFNYLMTNFGKCSAGPGFF